MLPTVFSRDFLVSSALPVVSSMLFARFTTLLWLSSKPCPSLYMIAASAAIPATTPITGSAAMAPPRSPTPVAPASAAVVSPPISSIAFPPVVITAPVMLISFPPTVTTGPIAAAIAAILTTCSFSAVDIWLNLSTRSCTHLTTSLIFGIMTSPNEIPSSSIWDLRIFICPPRLSCIVLAIRSAVPAELSTAFVSFSKSSSDPLITASHPAYALAPNMAFAAAVCSVSDS